MFQTMSNHSDCRASQRGLTEEEIEYILYFGKRHFCQGARVYYLRHKDLPPSDRRRDACTRLVGACVVLSDDMQTVITVWRNRKNGLKWLRKRSEKAARGSESRGPASKRQLLRDPQDQLAYLYS